MNVIVMTAWHRPQYTKVVIDALRQCYNIKDYTLLPHIEPDCDEVIDLFRKIDFMNVQMTVNEVRLGGPRNSYNALKHGFSMADYTILFEDDLVPSRDALQYFQWARETYRDDKTIFTITAYNRLLEVPPGRHYQVYRLSHFCAWMWATWIDRWKEIDEDWDFCYSKPTMIDGQPVKFPDRGWDINMDHKVRNKRFGIVPFLARCQNIGRENGLHCKPEFHDRYQFNPYWAGSVDLQGGEFHE